MSSRENNDPMYKAILGLSQQLGVSREIVQKTDLAGLTKKSFSSVILAGMGGSALPGEFVADYLREAPFSFRMVRDYQLPGFVGKKDLVICSSYSGNTEETLSVFHQARACKFPMLVMTHGGVLRDLAQTHRVPLIGIPACIQPRQALGNFFSSLVTLLERLKKIPSQGTPLKQLTRFLEKEQSASEAQGLELARHLAGRIPIIYGPMELNGACLSLKIKFNENSKIQSFFNVFPELNHNEMIGWTQVQLKGTLIYLVSQSVSKRMQQRMDVTEEMLRDKLPVYPISLRGKKRLLEMFHALQVGDFASYYLAKNNGVDPAPVEMVESLKKKLGKWTTRVR